MKRVVFTALCVLLLYIPIKAQIEPLLLYKASQDKTCTEWVEKTISQMSLKEKIGQLFIYTIAPVNTKSNKALLRDAVDNCKVGGLLFSGGKLQEQAVLTNYAQNLADIPLMITFDGEWGLGMRLKDTPSFPKNMVLGCIQNDNLIYEYGREVARECKLLGVQVNFAPVADVNINPHNPVINVRSFGKLPVNVSDKVIAYSSGLESRNVMAVIKHFPGHGDTDVDSHFALPTLSFTRERLDSVELYPFKQAIRSGISGVMVGHLQVPVLEPDLHFPSSLSRNVVYGLLRQELKFDGLIFTDALSMKGVSLNKNVCAYALKAGNDMVLTPRNIKKEIQGVIDEIEKGNISLESIENKCRKVLTYKYALGLEHKPHIQLSGLEKKINTPEITDLIRRLQLAAITVVGNETHTLPMHGSGSSIAVLSIGSLSADSVFVNGIKKHAPVKRFHLPADANDSVCMALFDELAGYKRVVVSITSSDLKPLRSFFLVLSQRSPVVYAFFVPFNAVEVLSRAVSMSSATILAHSAEHSLQAHVAGVIFGKASADGRLSVDIGKAFKAGTGVTITPQTPHYYAPEAYGMSSAVLDKIDSVALEGIYAKAYPGCQIVILKDGVPVFDKSYGTFTYEGKKKVQPTNIYDLASLSKTTATLLAIMKLYDKGKFNLSDKLSDYLTYLKGSNKADITIKELLLHESGLPASLPFYQRAIDRKSYKGNFFKNKKDASHLIQAGEKLFASSDFKYISELVSKVAKPEYHMQVTDSFFLKDSFKEEEIKMIINAPVKQKKYLYSCINFVLLKELVEKLTETGMDSYLEEEFFRPMGLETMGYLPLKKHSKERVVPSTNKDYLRKTPLQGYVHDQAAAFLGGVSGNAGLFASAREVAAIYQMLLNGGTYDGKRYLSKEACRLFSTTKSKTSRRGLGFDKPDSINPTHSPCSLSTPASAYGHTGFTGTCAWADPENNLVYVFLSNRTYPEPWNNKLQKMNIRPQIQEIIYESIKKQEPLYSK